MLTQSSKHWRKWIAAVVLLTLLTGFSVVPVAQASTYCTQWHTVQRGENLFRISLRYGTTVSYLQSLNGIPNANRIYAGQLLCVGTGSVGGTAYTVQWGDTLYKIARRYGVSIWTLANYNNITNINRIYAGQVLYIP